jgi:hypothetical protein
MFGVLHEGIDKVLRLAASCPDENTVTGLD